MRKNIISKFVKNPGGTQKLFNDIKNKVLSPKNPQLCSNGSRRRREG